MDKCHTSLYPFFWEDLGLKGLTKEVFAVLFGFWAFGQRDGVYVCKSGCNRKINLTYYQNMLKRGEIEL